MEILARSASEFMPQQTRRAIPICDLGRRTTSRDHAENLNRRATFDFEVEIAVSQQV